MSNFKSPEWGGFGESAELEGIDEMDLLECSEKVGESGKMIGEVD